MNVSYVSYSSYSNPPSGFPTRQEVVDILLQVMVRGEEHSFSVSYSVTVRMAKQVSMQEVKSEQEVKKLLLWEKGTAPSLLLPPPLPTLFISY